MDSGERNWNLNHKLWGQKAGQAGTKGKRAKKGKGEKEMVSFGVFGRRQGLCMCPQTHFILTLVLVGRYYSHPHLTSEKTEVQ